MPSTRPLREKSLPDAVYTFLGVVVATGFMLVLYALLSGSASD
jgi:hypothetical protein